MCIRDSCMEAREPAARAGPDASHRHHRRRVGARARPHRKPRAGDERLPDVGSRHHHPDRPRRRRRVPAFPGLTVADLTCDVLVVGAGNAALCAALSARAAGASVMVLERAPEDERGGNSRFTEGSMRFAFNGREDILKVLPDLTDDEKAITEFGSYPEDQFFDDIARELVERFDETGAAAPYFKHHAAGKREAAVDLVRLLAVLGHVADTHRAQPHDRFVA